MQKPGSQETMDRSSVIVLGIFRTLLDGGSADVEEALEVLFRGMFEKTRFESDQDQFETAAEDMEQFCATLGQGYSPVEVFDLVEPVGMELLKEYVGKFREVLKARAEKAKASTTVPAKPSKKSRSARKRSRPKPATVPENAETPASVTQPAEAKPEAVGMGTIQE